ncbi:MAG: carbohydrate-binding protein [Terracidiphilus sp.]|jgi:hypothetical protein
MKYRFLEGAIMRMTLCLFVLLASIGLLHAQTSILAINSGGPTSGSYVADEDFSGGSAASFTATVSTSKVTNPAPEAVYQTQRFGNFTYTLPGFTAGTTYTVRLHFAESYWTAAGSRLFNVLINGTQVLTSFDVFATAGGENIAIAEPFSAVANSAGQIVVQFVSVKDNAEVNGVEVDSATSGEAPYPGPSPAAVPGTVLAENYDTGGQGVAYNVTSTNGTANSYRSQGVDLEAASSPATGNDLGWTAAGQWFRYTVSVATAGTYKVSFLVASPAAVTDAFHLSNSSGANLSGSVAVPATGGYQTWVTVTATVTLPAGTQTLTLNQDAAGWNIDSMVFASGTTGGDAPYGGTPAAIPGTVQAENYDTGGQGVAYNVTSTNGSANSYRSDGVDLEATTDTGGGYDLGWTAAGQWFKYTVNVATAGTYTVTFRVAAPSAVTDAFHLSNASGQNLSGNVNVAATGGWQTWTNVTANVTLPAGTQTLTFNQDTAGWNLNYFSLAGGSTTPPAPPTGLTATAVSSSEINLSWTASTTSGVTYIVFENGSQIASNVTGTTYAATGLAPLTSYSYTVEATNSGGTSTADGPVSAETLGNSGGVAPPTSVTAVGSAYNQIDLRWVASTTTAPNTAPVNYEIYRSTTANFTPSSSNLIGTTIGITNYVDNNYPATTSPATTSGVAPSTTYYYQVVASTSSGTSTAVATSATSLPSAPSTAAPAALTGLTAMAENANEIDLIWNSTNSGVGTSVTTYSIYRSTTATFTPSSSNQIGATKSNWFQDALCTASTHYYYQVLASNSIGASPTSTTVSATTPALNPNLWGGAPFWDASGIPAKPAGATLMVKFLNRTNGMYTNSQITYNATINGATVNTSIAANPTYAMGANSAGRMYFFLNDPTGNEDDTDYWDFIEFTVGATSINMDTTRVDAFGLKIAFNLSCSDGTNVALGENEETFTEDRSVTFQRYKNAAPSTAGGDFQSDLVYAPYRIIEPGAAGFNAGGADQNYYANYISDIWSFNGITIPQAGPNGSGLPSNPDLSAAIFRHTAPISGTPEFNAAGDLTNQGMWGNPASFYQLDPYDHYAQWIEAQAINMQQYAFPYNDAGGYSSDIGCSNPNTLLVAIGW